MEVFRGFAGERQVSSLGSVNFYHKRNDVFGGKEPQNEINATTLAAFMASR